MIEPFLVPGGAHHVEKHRTSRILAQRLPRAARAACKLLVLAVAALGLHCKSEPEPAPQRSIAEGLESIALTVASTPAGARISLDGTDTGKLTPATFTIATGKDHAVALSHPDCLTYSQTVFAAPHHPVSIDATLKYGGRLRVSSDPPARILVDGKESFDAPGTSSTLPPGKHLALASAPDRAPESHEFEIAASETTEWSVKLDPGVLVKLGTTPPGAAIELDGKATGLVTPQELWLKPSKRHAVQLRLEGFVPVVRKLPDLAKAKAPVLVEVELQDSQTVDLTTRIEALAKRVSATERKLKALQARQSGTVISGDAREELALEQTISQLEEDLNQDLSDLTSLREELDKLEDADSESR
ncbi:MAG: PEGA domain-containing protein [Deltaproteobacteria bacterium]|nr:PEGA domain-containing protein [Deltaproteobacteria bacterium]